MKSGENIYNDKNEGKNNIYGFSRNDNIVVINHSGFRFIGNEYIYVFLF